MISIFSSNSSRSSSRSWAGPGSPRCGGDPANEPESETPEDSSTDTLLLGAFFIVGGVTVSLLRRIFRYLGVEK